MTFIRFSVNSKHDFVIEGYIQLLCMKLKINIFKILETRTAQKKAGTLIMVSIEIEFGGRY